MSILLSNAIASPWKYVLLLSNLLSSTSLDADLSDAFSDLAAGHVLNSQPVLGVREGLVSTMARKRG